MHRQALNMFAACAAVAVTTFAAAAEWPTARHFDGDHLLRVALPMGGIGCGSVSLSGRGDLVDWEIMNRANKTMSETERGSASRTFFAVRVKVHRSQRNRRLKLRQRLQWNTA